jgi:hypothetical protein
MAYDEAVGERVQRGLKERLAWLIQRGERSLRLALKGYVAHDQAERPHQGMGKVVPFPGPRQRG